MDVVKKGMIAWKIKKGRLERFFCIDESEEYLIEKNGTKEMSRIRITSIRDIIFENDDHSFTLITKNRDQIVIMMKDTTHFGVWVRMMNYFIHERGKIDLIQSEIGAFEKMMEAGTTMFFNITTNDALKRRVIESTEDIRVEFVCGKEIVHGDIVDIEGGLYRVGVVLMRSGQYNVVISCNNLLRVETLQVIPAKFDRPEIHIPKLIAGETGRIIIYLFDAFRNLIKSDIIKLVIFILIDVEDHYAVEMNTKSAGSYQLDIVINGKIHVCEVVVVPNVLDHVEVAWDDGVVSLNPFSLKISCFDAYENVLDLPDGMEIIVDDVVLNLEEILTLSFEFSGNHNVRVMDVSKTWYEGIIHCKPDSTEDSRRVELAEELERAETTKLQKSVEYEVSLWANGVSFITVLNEIVTRLLARDQHSIYLLDSSAPKDEITKTYRKCLFLSHPDHLVDQSKRSRIERNVIFNKLKMSHELYILYH